jgi:signal transduction histidine kinase
MSGPSEPSEPSDPGSKDDAPTRATRRVRIPTSLRWRLVGVFVLFAIATTAVFLHGMREVIHTSWHGYGRPLVAGTVDLMAREIGTPPDVAKAEALTRQMPLVIRIDGPNVHWASSNAPAHLTHLGMHADGPGDLPVLVERRLADGTVLRFGLAEPPAAGPSHDERAGWFTLGVLLLLTAAAYAYVRWLLRPLEDIREGAQRYGRGDFAHRIRTTRRDELGDLARRIDTMGAAIGRMMGAQRALLMAISHELRSPLTRARVNAELVADGPERDALLRDLGQMRDLIDDLLESERLSSGHARLVREPTSMAALVEEVLAKHFPDRPVRVDVAPGLPDVEVDRLRVRLLLRNLVDNALRHGGREPPPEVRVALEPGPPNAPLQRTPVCLRLTVRDHGPGVPEEELPRLSEAFHRPDPARQRATGGVGLGLTLCRLVVEAHGGTWRLSNAHPGLQVDVTLPSP